MLSQSNVHAYLAMPCACLRAIQPSRHGGLSTVGRCKCACAETVTCQAHKTVYVATLGGAAPKMMNADPLERFDRLAHGYRQAAF